MPKGLKVINRAGITLYDSAWTIGVDYEDKDNEYDNKEEESQSSDKSEDEEESNNNDEELNIPWLLRYNQDKDSDSNSSDNDSISE